MKNLGERLREAREGIGLSVRDVAEATHLRATVIENMESGKFDYDLPEIYKRGFLRLYAAFLKLDEKTVMEQYTALGRSPKEESKRTGILSRQAAEDRTIPEDVPSSVESRFDDADDSETKKRSEEFSKYLKLGGLITLLLVAVIIIILVITSFTTKPAPEANPDLSTANADISAPAVSVEAQSGINGAPAKSCVLKITASGDTYMLVYPTGEKNNVLFTGPIQAGETREFSTSKPLLLRVTDAEKISISRNGKLIDTKGLSGLKRLNLTVE